MIVFKTPGSIDLRAFTMFGVNAKPNSTNPIGFFGTGLKYAIAVLLREGHKVHLFTNGRQYEFYTFKNSFRGKDFDSIRMRQRKTVLWGKWRSTVLPYTLHLGRNWEVWQAFRELHSNTLDEQGITYPYPSKGSLENFTLDPDFNPYKYTYIIVEGPPSGIDEAYARRDEIFLPTESMNKVDETSGMEVYEGTTKYVYYRGLRVYELPKPTVYTYNLKQTYLTEDRTLKYGMIFHTDITNHVSRSENYKVIKHILDVDDDYYESSCDFSDSYYKPSDAFLEVCRNQSSSTNRTALRAYRTFTTRIEPPEDVKPLSLLDTLVEVLEEQDWDGWEAIGRNRTAETLELFKSWQQREGEDEGVEDEN